MENRDTHEYWVSTIMQEASDLLTAWETSFIESIDERLKSGRDLTEKQEETLEKIFNQRVK